MVIGRSGHHLKINGGARGFYIDPEQIPAFEYEFISDLIQATDKRHHHESRE